MDFITVATATYIAQNGSGGIGIQVAIALGALIAALAPLTAMFFTMRQSTGMNNEERLRQHVLELERRIDELESEVKITRVRNDELADENLRLMRKLLANGK